MKESFFALVIRLARNLQNDERVPWAFEKRVMARLREAKSADLWSMWLPTMRRSAFCGVAVVLMTVAYISYNEGRTPDLLAGDLERTVLASVNLDETW